MSTLIRHGHSHHDIWEIYTPVEVRVYYIECRLYELDDMRNRAISSRVSGADKKGWTEFTKSLDKNVAQMRIEIEDEVIEGNTVVVKGKKGADAFFKQLMNIPKINTERKVKGA